MPNPNDWNDQWNTGDAQIDQEHQKLFKMLLLFNEAWEMGYSLVRSTLDDVIAYTNYHFNHEEGRYAEMNFPELSRHKEQHREFLDQLHAFQDKLNQGEDRDALGYDFGQFLQNWLIQHIQSEDKRAFAA
ncbi:MAG: hemerythrin family protein [Magnetococcales bacterium]|nr:hemerythrin family protein [Magnetococcales bacterium]